MAWVYGCRLKLAQKDCARYEADTASRGYGQRIDGCPSCVHREPADAATAKADASHNAE